MKVILYVNCRHSITGPLMNEEPWNTGGSGRQLSTASYVYITHYSNRKTNVSRFEVFGLSIYDQSVGVNLIIIIFIIFLSGNHRTYVFKARCASL